MNLTLMCPRQNPFNWKRALLFTIGVVISYPLFLANAESIENCTKLLEKGQIEIYNDNTSHCVNNWMKSNKHDFDICKTRVCFVFIQQEPHVIIEDEGNLQKTPFECSKAKERGVKGAAIDVLTKRPSNYMCIWGGPREECTFNHLINFLYHFRHTHQFAFSNFLVDLPLRRCMHNIGAPLLADRIVLIGRVVDNQIARDSPSQMFTNLLRPFQSETWVLFSGLFFMIFTLGALVVRFLGPNKRLSLSRTLLFVMGNHEVSQRPHRHRFAISIISLLLNSSIVALSAIMVLFYEIAVVNFLFTQSSISTLKDISNISNEDLIEYCVNRNSAVDIVWRYSLNRAYTDSSLSRTPFAPSSSAAKCIDQIGDGIHIGTNRTIRFAVVLESTGRYMLAKKKRCGRAENDLVIFQTDVLYNFNGGFLYNDKVEKSVRRDVDSSITQLSERRELKDIFEHYFKDVPSTCNAAPSGTITVSTVLFPVMVLVIPCLFGSLLSLMREAIKQRNQNMNNAQNTAPSVQNIGARNSDWDSRSASLDIDMTWRRQNGTQGSTISLDDKDEL